MSKVIELIRDTFKIIAFLQTETEENKELVNRIEKVVVKNPHLNERDVHSLSHLPPNAFSVKKVKVSLFSTGRARTYVKRLIRDDKTMREHYNERDTESLKSHLGNRSKPYKYEFSGVFEFSSDEKSAFLEFLTNLLDNRCRNVLVITDDKLNTLRKSNFLDREVLDKVFVEEQSVIIQPFEYTEQIVKYIYLPVAGPNTGSILLTTYFSPLLRINSLKATFRKVMRSSQNNGMKSNKGTNFVSFYDDNLEAFLEFLGEEIPEGIDPAIRKLYDIITLITNPQVFPMLSGYVDYAGLYGASQILRGYTRSYYARLEDIESKVDLMIRGHIQKQYRKDTTFASILINCYLNRRCSDNLRQIYEQDPVLKSMLELLRTATIQRKIIYSSVVKSAKKELCGGGNECG